MIPVEGLKGVVWFKEPKTLSDYLIGNSNRRGIPLVRTLICNTETKMAVMSVAQFGGSNMGSPLMSEGTV